MLPPFAPHDEDLPAQCGPQERKSLQKLSRGKINVIVQAISGHGLFRGHIGKWMTDTDTKCILCKEGGRGLRPFVDRLSGCMRGGRGNRREGGRGPLPRPEVLHHREDNSFEEEELRSDQGQEGLADLDGIISEQPRLGCCESSAYD